ncbi:MAG: hypothetical protein J6B54_02985 [Clostridia bacterium]|nr:hypothetical protein [Clostridia bacterium]
MKDLRPRFSLLFADPDKPTQSVYSEETLAFLEPLPVGEEDHAVLLKILSLRTSRKDIAFRKEITEDFLRSPALFDKYEDICRKWEGLYETAKRERDLPPDADYEQALEALKVNTVSLMEHLSFLRRSADETARLTPDSGGLFALSEFLRQHGESESVKKLTQEIGNYPLLKSEKAKAVLQIHTDAVGAAAAADLRYLGNDDGKFLKKHPPRREDFSADLPKDRALELTTQAIFRLSDTFRALTNQIRTAFLPLKEGLVFYRFALSICEWAGTKGFEWLFPSPLATQSPAGKSIRDLREMMGPALSPVTLTSRPLEAYAGEWGTEILKIIARTQIFAAAGLPIVAADAVFCPDQTVVVYDSKGKTMEQEVAALAEIFHHTKKNDMILLNHPLITVGNAPAREITEHLLSTFLKKGACVRIAANWPTEELL